MNALLLAEFPLWIATTLDGLTPAALPVYETTPPLPASVPYVTVGGITGPGEGWNVGMLERQIGSAGWVGVQLRGHGRAKVDATWALDQVRVAWAARAAGAIVFPSGATVNLASILSEGPPTQPVSSGTLLTVTETYRFFLEAV